MTTIIPCKNKKSENNGCTKKIKSKGFTVLVEGNIGCGKSTFLDHFKGSPDIEILEEPVKLWTNVRGHNILDMFYQNQKNWYSAFQSFVTLTQLQQLSKEWITPVRMIERSLYSSRYCFTENMINNKLIEDVQCHILDDWFNWATGSSGICDVDLFVYLRTSPQTCFERVKMRSRPEEDTLPLEYLEQLHEQHENWLIKHKYGEPDAPVLIIDTSKPLEQLRNLYEEHRDAIMVIYTKQPYTRSFYRWLTSLTQLEEILALQS